MTLLDRLDAYLPVDRYAALATGRPLPDPATGSALFADISGFTPLTEALAEELGSRRGAEELVDYLNQVYDALITEVHAYGGSVIGFSGDGVTCWFEGDDGQRALTCALAMQRAIAPYTTIHTILGSEISLGLKVAVTGGSARRFAVGAPELQTIDVLAGPLLDRLSTLEGLARRGEVIVDGATASRLSGVVAARRRRMAGEADAVVVEALGPPAARVPWSVDAALGNDIVRTWLLPAVYQRLQGGHGGFLAELRPVTALFLMFSGIDYEGADAGERLDRFIRWVQATTARYDGALLQLTIGDKGSYLFCAFGAPIAHEDDTARALSVALELRSPPPDLGFVHTLKIGVSRGRACAGDYGSRLRRTYGVLGAEVNVAARLMSAARPGQILVTQQVVTAVGEVFEIDRLPPLALKGVAQRRAVYAVGERRRSRQAAAAPEAADSMVGRAGEGAVLQEQLDALAAGRGGCVLIEGEAGIGKSRLVDALRRQVRGRDVAVLIGAGDSIERLAPYHAWRPIVAQLLQIELAADEGSAEAREALRAQAQGALQRANPELAHLAPLLGAVLQLDWADNELTRHLAGEVRARNTQELLVGLLKSAMADRPLLLVIEDAHWLDTASWALLRLVRREVERCLLMVVVRPLGEGAPAEYGALAEDPAARRLRLEALPRDDIAAIVRQHLRVARVADPIVGFIYQTAEGHPFFSVELAYALRDAGLIVVADGACRLAPGTRDLHALDFPDTIQGVITSRIDRLAADQQLTVKIASVLGRLFFFRLLRTIHPVADDEARLRAQLDTLSELELILPEASEPELAYLFKHIITHEVAYNLMTFAQRRQLHRMVAEWYERSFADDLASYAPLLAHHWRRASGEQRDDAELAWKALGYLERAGQQALRGNANKEALDYFSEALDLAGHVGPRGGKLLRARLLRLRGEASNRLGLTKDCLADLEQALVALEMPQPASQARLARGLLREVGAQALARTGRAPRRRDLTDGEAAIAREVAEIQGALVVMYFFMSRQVEFMYATLRAVNLAEAGPPSRVLAEGYATLCVVCGLIGQTVWADGYARRALDVADQLGEPSVLGAALLRVGMYRTAVGQWAAARGAFEQAIAHYQQIKDDRGWGDTINALIRTLLVQGHYAESLRHAATLERMGRRYENTQHEAWGHETTASNLLRQGQHAEALAHTRSAMAVQGETANETEKFILLADLALAGWRSGDRAEVMGYAEQVLGWLAQTTAPSFAILPTFFNTADLYLDALEERRRGGGGGAEEQALADGARRACAALQKFAGSFAIGRPAALLCAGRLAAVQGRAGRAQQAWRKGLALAEQLDMPYEQARLHLALGSLLPPGSPARAGHLRKAAALFSVIGCAYELGQARTALDQG